MPDARADSGVARPRRLPALLASITLVSGAAVVRPTVERLHNHVSEARRFRARLAGWHHESDGEGQEVTAAGDGAVLPAHGALRGRAPEVCQVEELEESCDALPESLAASADRSKGVTSSESTRAVAGPARADKRITATRDVFTGLTALATNRAQEPRSVPTLWPVRGAVSSSFGWRRSPFGGASEWHPGIDIAAPCGTPVHATADGEVVFAGRAHGYGVLVVLDHGASETRYAHLSAIWVHLGQAVLRGESVGALGGTGRATAPHLHYEVRLGSEPLDPQCLLTSPAGTMLAGRRRSHACALARARFEDRRSRATARDAARVTSPRAGVAG